ncbi:MAG: murein L,D-transpeptidase family protein [Pseudomonadota bacterium]
MAAALVLTPTLAACTAEDALRGVGENRGEVPISKKLYRAIKTKGMSVRAPIMIRIFKEEDTLEVWKRKPNGRYELLADYEICKWSGKLGPKFKEGDRQAPEGFYSVAPHQMNPRSSYHLSFNMGFPNKFDASYGRTGTHLMIHGDCSSAGCYSMTDAQIEDIYALAREALRGGQKRFQIQAFPFRMTPENMAKHRNSEHFEFWQNLKVGYDHFELTKVPPTVRVCGRTYQFNKDFGEATVRASASCPTYEENPNLVAAYSALASEESKVFAKLSAKYDLQAEREKAAAEAAAARQIARLAPAPPVEPAPTAELAAPEDAPAGPVVTATPSATPSAISGPVAGTESTETASVPVPQSDPRDAVEAEPSAGRSMLGRVKGLFGG